MVFTANVLKVMIASPGDVAKEREIVAQEIYRWNDANAVARELILQPVRWETHSSPQMGAQPQEILNEHLLADADIVIGIFGTRVGTATKDFISGTVEEIKRHVTAGKLVMLYFSHVPVDPNSIDREQWDLLQSFKQECRESGLYAEFSSHEEFRGLFGQHLTIELNKPKYRWISRPSLFAQPHEPDLDQNAVELLLAAASDKNGYVMIGSTMGGFHLQSDDRNFVDDSARSVALWKRVLQNLTQLGYLKERNEDVYEITAEGFERADAESAKQPLQLSAAITGQADQQRLSLHSSKPIRLSAVEYLMSSGARISGSEIDIQVPKSAEVPLDHKEIIKLYNSPRPDRNHHDLSGPAVLRLTVESNGHRFQPELPVLLLPKTINNTQWIGLQGAKAYSLQ